MTGLGWIKSRGPYLRCFEGIGFVGRLTPKADPSTFAGVIDSKALRLSGLMRPAMKEKG